MVLDRQPVLESELLVLRPITSRDREPLWRIASDPLLWEQHPSKERALPDGFGRWFDDARASGGALTAVERSSGEVIGTSRFDRYRAEEAIVEIGWTFVARSLWGGPYNAEMKRLMLDHAFGSVEVVQLRVHSANLRSRRAVEKLGAAPVGTEEDPHGRGTNIVFALTAVQHRRAAAAMGPRDVDRLV